MKRLLAFLSDLGIAVPDDWPATIDRFYELLLERNRICNLTRITDYQDFLYKHVADSLLATLVMPELTEEPLRVLDVGCGAGIPGLILAITYPNLLCSEVDSKHKKAAAVQHFIETLEIENAEAVQGNAFELSNTPLYNEQIDVVIARAVGRSPKLIQQSRRFLTPDTGLILAYKTPQQIDEERLDVQNEGKKRQHKLKAEASREFQLPGEYGRRQFWVMRQAGRPKR